MNRFFLLPVFLVILLVRVTSAQDTKPLNSNYLIDRGVSPLVLDAAADILLQDGSFFENIDLEIKNEAGSKKYQIGLIYDPDYKYGKDIRFVVKEGTFNKKETKNFKKAIEKTHQYSRLSRKYLYDEKTLSLIKKDGQMAVLEYYYQRNDLEPGLADIKRFKGQIYFLDNELQKVVLTNTKKLKASRMNFERVVYFERVKDYGGHIVSSIEEKYAITKGKNLRTINSTTRQ